MTVIGSSKNNTNYMHPQSFKQQVFEQFETNLSSDILSYSYSDKEIKNKFSYKVKKYIGLATLSGIIISFTTPSIRYKLLSSIKEIAGDNYQLFNPFNKDLDAITKLEVSAKRIHNSSSDKFINILYNLDHLKNYTTGLFASTFEDLGTLINRINSKLEPRFYGAVINSMRSNYNSVIKANKAFETTILDIIPPENPSYKKISGLMHNLHESIASLAVSSNIDSRLDKWFKILDETYIDYTKEIKNIFQKRSFSDFTQRPVSFGILNEKKQDFTESLFELSRKISFTPKHKINLLKYLQDEIIKGNPELVEKFIPKIKNIITDISKGSTNDSQGILNLLDELSKYGDKPKSVDRILKITKKIFTENKEGNLELVIAEFEEMASLGKISEESLKTVKDQAGRLVKKLQEALDFEMEKMTGRMLDLKIGPTPFLEASALCLLPLGLLKTMINDDDCFEEKISKVIKYTPPLIGGIGGIMFSLKRGIFGANAVLFGLFTGWICQKLGDFIDKRFYSKGREFNIEKALKAEQLSNSRFNIQKF